MYGVFGHYLEIIDIETCFLEIIIACEQEPAMDILVEIAQIYGLLLPDLIRAGVLLQRGP